MLTNFFITHIDIYRFYSVTSIVVILVLIVLMVFILDYVRLKVLVTGLITHKIGRSYSTNKT